MPAAKRRRRGRPKGTYKRTPAIHADFHWDTQIAAEELEGEGLKSSKSAVAERLQQKFSEKYKRVTKEQLQNLLSEDHLRKKNQPAIDAYNNEFLAHLLGELKK
jgi:hypothetical protein